MKKILSLILFVLFLFSLSPINLFSCTIFNSTKSGITLVGNNEDGTDPITYVWFLPPGKGKYGRVYFGLSDKWPQGGMNDKGLFYDGTAAPLFEITKSKNKPIYPGNLSEKMLEECATVAEALKLLGKYNLNYFRNGEMMIVDKFGNSVIVEGDNIIYKKENFQVVTNFYQSKPNLGGYPCPRYDIAESMLKNNEEISIDFFCKVLDSVHTKGYTQYSNIYDLKNCIIYLFKDSNFREYVKLNLQRELQKGKELYAISALFSDRSARYEVQNGKFRYTGKYLVHHKNGKIKSEILLKNGKLSGKSCGYYKNGQISWERDYENGKLSHYWRQWNESGGKILDIEIYNEYISKAKEFYPGGKKLYELTFDKIVPDKLFVWNEDGTLCFSAFFKNGLLHMNSTSKPFTGELVTHYENGKKHIKRSFRDGKKDGVFIEWDERGIKIKEEIFKKNVLIKVNRFETGQES